MSILDRSALEESPLADLHAIAFELSIDGYRRLRKAELIDAILERQGGEAERPAARRQRSRRGGRGRGSSELAPTEAGEGVSPKGGEEASPQALPAQEPGREAPDTVVEGVVELLPNGSGFARVNPPEPSDDDIYISAAQVKRCELVSGDRISGPRRAPRRSERFSSLIRVDTINGLPAADVADAARFDDLPAAFPSERFRLGSDDPTVKAIEWLTPIGKGSRVSVAGPPCSGKTEALRRLAAALAQQDSLTVFLVLVGVRPEEISEWTSSGPLEPAAAMGLGASDGVQAQALERIIDQGRRLAARGTDAVVLIDSLIGVSEQAARRALGSARDIVDGGSLTVIATSAVPVGGETTLIVLDPVLTSTGRFPSLDLVRSWTIRSELLVGEAGAAAIAGARSEALEER